MNEKPININMVTNNKKPTTVNMGIVDLLQAVELNRVFISLLTKQGNELGLRPGAAAVEFIFAKHEELKAYVNTHKKDGTTLDELKTLISGWIAEQERLVNQMGNVMSNTKGA